MIAVIFVHLLVVATEGIVFSCCVSMCLSVRDHILKVCEHEILLTACGNFTSFKVCIVWRQR